jgi:hypothetical protein
MSRRTVRSNPLMAEATPEIGQYSMEPAALPQREPAALPQREPAALPQYEPVIPEPIPVPAPAVRLAPPAVPHAAALAQYAPAVPEPVAAARLAPPAVPHAAALAQYAPVVPEPVAAARLAPPAVQYTPDPRPSLAKPNLPKLPATQAQLPWREVRTPLAQEAIQPMTKQNSNLPWWLADLVPQTEETRPAAIPEPATVRGAQPAAAEYRPMAAAPMPRHEQAPVQSWERLPRIPAPVAADSSMEWKPVAGPQEFREPEVEQPSTGLATRLSGLRSLLSVLGVKDQQRAPEPPLKIAEAARQPEPAIDRTDYTRTMPLTPALATPAGSVATGGSPRIVNATPEFLPPRPTVEAPENSEPSRFRKRRDRRDDFDDVQILPSWRGQYRK